jgi:hypothetical protein
MAMYVVRLNVAKSSLGYVSSEPLLFKLGTFNEE